MVVFLNSHLIYCAKVNYWFFIHLFYYPFAIWGLFDKECIVLFICMYFLDRYKDTRGSHEPVLLTLFILTMNTN